MLSNQRGRGALENPTGRFEPIEIIPIASDSPSFEEESSVKTRYFRECSGSIIATNDSPDVGFEVSINPYRGCEHGCVYCYARPTHEYLGLSCGLDFESLIFVKENAPELLRKALSARSWKPQPLAISGVTDPYQPVERALKLTRRCLEVLAEFRNPVAIVTKSALVTRDVDILSELAQYQAVHVFVSVTTLNETLQQRLEPRAASPKLRLAAIRTLRDAGIPVGVLMGPIIPGLTDTEIADVLKASSEAGAQGAYYTMLRLPYGVKDLFSSWLEAHYPLRKQKVLSLLRQVRAGALNDSQFGRRMIGEGPYADMIARMFHLSQRRFGLEAGLPPLSTEAFHFARGHQLFLF